MSEVQTVRGGQDVAVDAGPKFVEVLVEATGRTETVPAAWIDDPVLGRGISPVEAAPPPEPAAVEDAGEPPTEANTHAEIDDYADRAHIDLGEAANGTKAEKVSAIAQALAALPQPEPQPNPDVQLVAGDVHDEPVVGAAQMSASDNEPTDGTEPSDENPASPDKEN